MPEGYCVVLSTFDDPAVAERIIAILLKDRLAACVQALPVTSHYRWDGELTRETETLLLIKTRAELFDQVAETIRAHHSYEVPEIVQIPIENGLPAYLDWMASETGPT